jgi:hypothetical protein
MTFSVLDGYDPQGSYCEMLRGPASRAVRERLAGMSIEALKQRAATANAELYNWGITFTVYSDAQTIDRILPFDVIPRAVRDPRQAVPVSGTWTGFPSDALGMTVEVEVTAESPERRSGRRPPRDRGEAEPRAAGA